jgi:hypothetical protein
LKKQIEDIKKWIDAYRGKSWFSAESLGDAMQAVIRKRTPERNRHKQNAGEALLLYNEDLNPQWQRPRFEMLYLCRQGR